MKRIPLPDLLKGFAVFLIVPVHILELFINFYGRETVFGHILLFMGGPVAVPVFMIIMGYFMAKNNKTFRQNFFRGVKVFTIGLFLNVGLNFHLLLKKKYSGWEINPLEYIFGVDILFLAGISIMVLSVIKRFTHKQQFFALGLALLISILSRWMNGKMMTAEPDFFIPFIAGDFSWSYFPLFPWLTYPLIGFAFYYLENKLVKYLSLNKLPGKIIIISTAILILVFSKTGFQTTIHLPAYYHHTFWYSLWALGIVGLWALLWRSVVTKFAPTPIGNFFQWLGRNITIFYIVQWLIIGNIATAIFQTQSLKTYPIWFLSIFLITVLLTRLVEKTKFHPT